MSNALATLALLVSGIFAAIHHVGFLTPAAALGVGLPFVISSAVFSVAIVFLTVVISKNKTIAAVSVLEKKEQKNSELRNKVRTQKQRISEREAEIFTLERQLVSKEKAIEVKNEIIRNLDELKRQKYVKKKQEKGLLWTVQIPEIHYNLSGKNFKKSS